MQIKLARAVQEALQAQAGMYVAHAGVGLTGCAGQATGAALGDAPARPSGLYGGLEAGLRGKCSLFS